MRSLTSWTKPWKAAGTRMALLIMLQALGPGVVWPQESAQPQTADEIARQDKIYRSRDGEVPSGYVTGRGLSDYAELLPSGFCDELGRLRSSDRWLDIGAGEGQAILDYYAPAENALSAAKCGQSGARAYAVAMSIEDRRTDKWREQAAGLLDGRIRYLSGKRLRNYSLEELGTFQIITDVYGGFSYSENLSQFVDKTLSLLNTGGIFYTMVQGVHLENGKDKPNASYQTELVDAAGQDVKVCTWLKKIACVKVGCESRSDWDSPTELIRIRKVCSDVAVPRTKLLKYEAGNPPTRRFQLEP